MRPPKSALIRIGGEIRDARARSGLSQAVLAEKAGIPCATLSRIERGEDRKGEATVDALAAIVRVVGPLPSFVAEPPTSPDLSQAHRWTYV